MWMGVPGGLQWEAYHGEAEHAILGHEALDERPVDFTHVVVVVLLGHTGLAVGADGPGENGSHGD